MAEQSHKARTTTDHDEIRAWCEARGGLPSAVRATHADGDIGILRIDFVGDGQAREESLEEISWEEFFEQFEARKLAFLHQDETADGGTSRFFKFVKRAD